MNREKRIFRITVLSTLALAAVALYGLMQQAFVDRRRSAAAVAERAHGIADDLREQLREAGADVPRRKEALTAALVRAPENLAAKPMGAFVWEPKNGVIFHECVPKPLLECLAGRVRWLDWCAPGRKAAPRRALAEIADVDGETYRILWGRVDNSLYALVFDHPPVEGDFSWWLWAALAAGVALAAAAVIGAAVALRRAAEQARLNDELKTRFVADVSHELKTPLVAMSLWTDMLKAGLLPNEERRQHAMDVVADEKDRMLRMVEQLLEFSCLTERRRSYKFELVDVGAVVEEVGELFKGELEGGLEVTVPEGTMAYCDRDALKGILVNLLGNVVKYASQEGVVEVSASRSAKPLVAKGEGEWIQLRVSDRGPGIPAERREQIFQRFQRGDDNNAKAKGGFGLGLPISRELARDMKGELSVHSRSDGEPGAVFLLELPVNG